MGKQVTELDALPSFTDTSLLPVHNGAGLKKGLLSQLTNYLGNKFSNPNILINPDFKINQRGSSTYTTTSESPIYTVDRWMLSRGRATVNSDKTVTITATGGTTNKEGYFQQKLENAISGAYTVSMEVVSISGTVRIAIDGEWKTVTSGKNVFQGVNSSNNFDSVGLQLAVGASITLKYMKLEQGSVATSFVAPNPAEELVKCRRYYTIIGNTLIGYVMSSVSFYMGITEPLSIREGGTVAMNGNNNSNYLRCDGNATKVNIDVSKSSYDSKYIRLYLSGNSSAYDSRVCALDCSSAIIVIDAEIY